MDIKMKKALPYALVFEEPSPDGIQLRYQKEGEVSGKIIGTHSTPEHTTYPKICVVSMTSSAYVQVSCVTVNEPYRPHPHKLVHEWEDGNSGEICNGVVTAHVKPHFPVAEFNNVRLQYIPREGVKQSLTVRQAIPVNPFSTSEWKDSEMDDIDLNNIRLCFHVFIKTDIPGKFQVVTPIVSEPIYLKPPTRDA